MISLMLLLIAIQIQARWEGPVTVEEKNVSFAGMYYDSLIDANHVAWCANGNLSYTILKHSKYRKSIQRLFKMTNCKTPFIISHARKVFIVGTNSEPYNSSLNISKMYYLESSDSGETWSRPMYIGGYDVSISREAKDIELSPEMGRLWIIYSMKNLRTSRNYIAFAMKKIQSPSFMKDVVIASGKIGGFPSFVYKKGMLYFAWNEVFSGTGGLIKFSRSADYGISWSKPYVIESTNVTELERFRLSLVTGFNETYKDVLYLGYHSYETIKAHLRISIDQGRTWSDFIELSDSVGGAQVILSSCSPSEVYAMTQDNSYITFQYYNAKNETLMKKVSAFTTKTDNVGKITCAYIGGKVYLHALFSSKNQYVAAFKYHESG